MGSERYHTLVLSAVREGRYARKPSASENPQRKNEKLELNWFCAECGVFFVPHTSHQAEEEKKQQKMGRGEN